MPFCTPCSPQWAERTRTTRWVGQGAGLMSLAGLSWVSLIASSKELGKWSRDWAQGALNYWGSTGEVGMQSGAVPWAWVTPK